MRIQPAYSWPGTPPIVPPYSGSVGLEEITPTAQELKDMTWLGRLQTQPGQPGVLPRIGTDYGLQAPPPGYKEGSNVRYEDWIGDRVTGYIKRAGYMLVAVALIGVGAWALTK